MKKIIMLTTPVRADLFLPFEFKRLKLSNVKLSGAEVKKLSLRELEALEPVKEKKAEAEKQLLDYQIWNQNMVTC